MADHLPVLVAPRPVRLAISTVQQRMRQKQQSQSQQESPLALPYYSPSESPPEPQRPPTSSPGSALPTEALEEFLSILRPSFFQPSSPRIRRHPSATLPAFQHDRGSIVLRPRARIDIPHTPVDELDLARSGQSSRATGRDTPDSALTPNSTADVDPTITDSPPIRWFTSNLLASPISRNQTRNPFPRHIHDQSPSISSPTAILTPSAIPLPSPSPDELLEI
ncbi:hypothetical protein BDN72DRAFT_246035 [Pluteus cervinus]|uniref:Uncharacterized protein n=1 Tax=Pluteus cervinus TaxID=181527 RepID=A0ACD3BEY3_9AGAR|nr:hypothetical protein BDN72DRAFT_246035 [Pluteus cervinus]